MIDELKARNMLLAALRGQRTPSRSRVRSLLIAAVAMVLVVAVWTSGVHHSERLASAVSTLHNSVTSAVSGSTNSKSDSDANADAPPAGVVGIPGAAPDTPQAAAPIPAAPVDIPAADELPAEENTTPLFILCGDSTTNGQLRGGGGWGDAFLWLLMRGAEGVNKGVNGALSTQYHASGFWNATIARVRAAAPVRKTYVTVQFGHNDQNPAFNITLDMFQDTLAAMAREVAAAGGTPLLVSPLARRDFKPDTWGGVPRIVDNLGAYRNATRRAYDVVASEQAPDVPNRVRFVDLNAASLAYLAALGQTRAFRYNKYHPAFPDTTHLNEHGSVVFARVVADLVLGHPPALVPAGERDPWAPGAGNDDDGLSGWIEPNPYLTGLIWHGDFA